MLPRIAPLNPSTPMATPKFILQTFLASFLLFSNLIPRISCSDLKTYIVQVRPPADAGPKSIEKWYYSFLPNTTTSSGAPRMVYQYTDAISGFAARLTEAEVSDMAKKDGFLTAHLDRVLPLLTTHTPSFLGLHRGDGGVWDGSSFGKGVIIAMLDTGIKPGHPSFDDHGMPPPPKEWKGSCRGKLDGCNNKVIGAWSAEGWNTTISDAVGHGTHTASTAAGNSVEGAGVLGNCNGTATGMAPLAHLAIYRVCGVFGCSISGVLAGMDAAIKDGADVLSLSLGGASLPFPDDVIAIGAFAAMSRGIFVSCAAGNAGPESSSLSNEAPWILTVGASTIDRNIRATVELGDGQVFDGESLFQPDNFTSKMLPVVYPPVNQSSITQGNCNAQAMKGSEVKGKVVVCHLALAVRRTDIGKVVKEAGGAAMILLNSKEHGYTTLAEAHYLPASNVNYQDGLKIVSYVNSSSKPTASITFKGTIMGNKPAPAVAYFSSRGPNQASPGILKPDIIGPGVSILAGWPSPVGPVTSEEQKQSNLTFNIISGTSMSTPHLSGIAALVKSVNKNWSPAAIKSAIMTTSDIIGNNEKPIKDEQFSPAGFYSMGTGHVNPAKAVHPGLIYNLTVDDYISYLCGMGYTDKQVEVVTRRPVACAEIKKISESELNYPSITVSLGAEPVTVTRTVTNVGEAKSSYKAKVEAPEGVEVSVAPEALEFSEMNEEKSFTVTMRASSEHSAEGSISWSSGKYVVRSPIVVKDG